MGDMSLPTAANPTDRDGRALRGEQGRHPGAGRDARRGTGSRHGSRFDGRHRRIRCALAEESGFGWPVVLKPDIGCNGSGVSGWCRMRPALVGGGGWVSATACSCCCSGSCRRRARRGCSTSASRTRRKGRITSVTLKHAPFMVTGDGRVDAGGNWCSPIKRAGRLKRLYLSAARRPRRAEVPEAGQVVPLVFAGNHCKGSDLRRRGRTSITPALTRQCRPRSRATSQASTSGGSMCVTRRRRRSGGWARSFTIIEVNGAGSEATHIWDARCSLREAYAAQFSPLPRGMG